MMDLAPDLRSAPFAPWKAPLEGGEDRRQLVAAAILSANAHNTQPWRFEIEKDTIAIFADVTRNIGVWDSFRREMHESLGCALENLTLAASAHGLSADIELKPGRLEPGRAPDGPSAVVTLRPGARERSDAFVAIARRHTHRGPYNPERAVPETVIAAMNDAARDTPLELVLLVGRQRTH